jgi:hypothetical protein
MNCYIKKTSKAFSIFLFLSAIPLHAMDDLYSFDDPFTVSIATFMDESPAIVRAPELTPVDVATLLINAGAQNILQLNLYCRTNPLIRRSLLDNPLFLPQRDDYQRNIIVGAHLFWNHMPRAYFTQHCSRISSYLALEDPDLIFRLEEPGQLIEDQFNINYKEVLPLFAPMTIQERQLGLMIHAMRYYEKVSFRIQAPLYYFERNFFLNESQQEALENVLGATSQDEQNAFGTKHLVSDKFGLGDTRITIDMDSPWSTDRLDVRYGAFATVPTAVAFKKGLKGSYFPKCSARPTFDLIELVSLGTSDAEEDTAKALAMAEAFMTGALDQLSANLIDDTLGNRTHFGLGAEMLSNWSLGVFIKRPWAHELMFKGRISLEYLFPATEQRFYTQATDAAAFAALGLDRPVSVIENDIANVPGYAEEVVDFLETQFIDTLYPFVFPTKVRPGMIFRWTSKASHEDVRWGFFVGSDTWIQTREKLYNINMVGACPPNISIPKATRNFAYEAKIIGSLYFNIFRNCKDWTIGINADQTVATSGIGENYTITLNLEANF